MSAYSLLLVLTTKPLVRINIREKTVNDSPYFATSTNFLHTGLRTVVLGFFKLNIKARYKIRESLNANL